MPKLLKPYTIIPTELYVQRDADRQIKNIITDMGRPGYVLVSRQMGKTNLLLNAKRKLESPNDVFVYIDLSNPFETARSCFENIIDTAIETNHDRFQAASEKIIERRKESDNLPPHKQHTNELRYLLQSLSGKLVIILDEIDALTKTVYSDQIFAQIRSIYFSRVNYKELENLTYILSGVIEPTEIIKDSKISPFNIGQKIFLNDFTYEEFEQFLEKSRLVISEEAKNRIYFWTGGNPRMTWDICSEVENIIKNSIATEELIDKIVQDLYLTAFDKPPIDNIRELVTKDKEIRNAIFNLEANNSAEISDKLKNKLYLSGIINYDENAVVIKNEIIRQALNLSWLKALEEEDKGLVRIAIDLFDNSNYSESLNTFERFLTSDSFDEANQALSFYYMGYAAYRTSKFEKSIEYLNKSNFDLDEEPKWYYRSMNLKGLAYYYDGDIDRSLEAFKQVVQSGRQDEIYVRALINFGSIALKSGTAKYKDDSISIFTGIINGTSFKSEKLKPEFINELRSISHYNLGQILQADGKATEAINNYKEAIILAKEDMRSKMILSLLNVTVDPKERIGLLMQLIDPISEGKIVPLNEDPEEPLSFGYDELRDLFVASALSADNAPFEKLKQKISLLGDKTLSAHLYDLSIYTINKYRDRDGAHKLLKLVYNHFDDEEYEITQEIKYGVLKLLAFIGGSSNDSKIAREYVKEFAMNRLERVDYLDFEIFADYIYGLKELKLYHEALNHLNTIIEAKPFVSDILMINYLVVYNLELNIYYLLNQREKVLITANKIISMSNDENLVRQNSNLLGETGLETIKSNAENLIESYHNLPKPIRSTRSYGRNQMIKVKYKNGEVIEVKFKKVQLDLVDGKCIVVE